MHIPDGLLPPTDCILGYGITGGVTWFSLRQIDRQGDAQQQIPKASLLTAAFFVASLIHIPVPPASIHLVLNGVMGIVLGYYAFPAILIGLLFQTIFFHHGGLSSLGVNAVIMGVPALVAHYIWSLRRIPIFDRTWATNIFAFGASSITILLSAFVFVLLTFYNIAPDLDIAMEQTAILTSLIGYGVQAVIEGLLTVMLINFLLKVKPEIMEIGR